jgi:hypothetical protein
MPAVRPTLRCLREDLHLPIPPARVQLETIEHPLLVKAGEQFADPAPTRAHPLDRRRHHVQDQGAALARRDLARRAR